MKTEKEKMLAGEYYNPQEPELMAERLRARTLFTAFNASGPVELEKRESLLKELLNIQGAFEIEPPFFCDYGTNIEIDENFFANFNCVILDVCKVTIGKNVMFGPAVQIYTASHPLKASERIKGLENGKPITIGDNVWIGGGAIICPGVTIGSDTTIGAGAVVTKDIPDHVFAGGNPCKVIRQL